jgi:hypothetical protein
MAVITRAILKTLYEANPSHSLWDDLKMLYWFDGDATEEVAGRDLTLVAAGSGSCTVDSSGLHMSKSGATSSSSEMAGAYWDGNEQIFADDADLELTILAITNQSMEGEEPSVDELQGIVLSGLDNSTAPANLNAVAGSVIYDESGEDWHGFFNKSYGTPSYAPPLNDASGIADGDDTLILMRTRPYSAPDHASSQMIIKGGTEFDTDDGQETTSTVNKMSTAFTQRDQQVINIGNPYWDQSAGSDSIPRTLGQYLRGDFNVKALIVWNRYVDLSEFAVTPDAPTGLTATAADINAPGFSSLTSDGEDSNDLVFSEGDTNQKITLDWTKSSGATGYKIYRDTTSPATTLLTTVGDVDTYDDDTVDDQQEYFYRLKATNAAGDSDFSSEVSDTWYDYQANSLYIYRSTTGTPDADDTVIGPLAGETTTYEDTDIERGLIYYYRLRDISTEPKYSAYSTELSVGVDITSSDVPTLTAYGETQADLLWTGVDNATSYTLYKGTESGSYTLLQSGLTDITYTDTDVTGGTTYFYVVDAVFATGETGRSNEASVAIKTASTESFVDVRMTIPKFTFARPKLPNEPYNRGAVT